jgi:hypothetical protein
VFVTHANCTISKRLHNNDTRAIKMSFTIATNHNIEKDKLLRDLSIHEKLKTQIIYILPGKQTTTLLTLLMAQAQYQCGAHHPPGPTFDGVFERVPDARARCVVAKFILYPFKDNFDVHNSLMAGERGGSTYTMVSLLAMCIPMPSRSARP